MGRMPMPAAPMPSRWWFYPALIAVSLALVVAGVAALTVVLLWPNLPSLEVLTDYRPKIPLRIYSAEGELIGEFGEEKRAVVKIKDVPQVMKAAILAAEDDRFYQHGGVDYLGVVRAAAANRQGRREGASTITMQVARTFFLTREKTFARKLSEVLLAFKIEANLTRHQILELYINQIFLGQRAYGYGSAANRYFGHTPPELTPAEAVRTGVVGYGPRTGYRGAEGFHPVPATDKDVEDAVEEALQDRDTVNEMVAAVVLEASPKEVIAMMRRGDEVKIAGDGLKF